MPVQGVSRERQSELPSAGLIRPIKRRILTQDGRLPDFRLATRWSGALREPLFQPDQGKQQKTQAHVRDAHLRQREALVQGQAHDPVDHLYVNPVDEEGRDAELLEP